MSTADILNTAADHMERVGQHKGCLYDHNQIVYGRTSYSDCRVDIGGALCFVIFGMPFHDYDPEDPKEELIEAAIKALAERLDCIPLYLCDWNDRHSQEQVLDLLRSTARQIQDKASASAPAA